MSWCLCGSRRWQLNSSHLHIFAPYLDHIWGLSPYEGTFGFAGCPADNTVFNRNGKFGRVEDKKTWTREITRIRDTFSFWHTSLLAELTGHAQFECGDFNRSSIWLENVPKPVCNLNCPDPSNVPFGFIYIMLLGSSSKIQYDPIWSNVWRCFRRFSRMFSLCSTLAFRQLVELFVSAKAWRIHERWGKLGRDEENFEDSWISDFGPSELWDLWFKFSQGRQLDVCSWICRDGDILLCLRSQLYVDQWTCRFLGDFGTILQFFEFFQGLSVIHSSKTQNFECFSCLFFSRFYSHLFSRLCRLCTSALHLAGCLPFAPCNGLITTSAIDNCSLETILCDGIGPGVSCNVHCKPPYVGPPGGKRKHNEKQ